MTRYVFTRNPDGSYRAATLAGRALGTLARVRVSNRVPAEVRWQAVDRDGRRVGPPQASRDKAAELLDAQQQPRDTIYSEGRCARLAAVHGGTGMNLLASIPQDQFDRIQSQDCDIDWDFLGFTDIYEHLAQIIPLHFRVVDLGCRHAPQCFYFTAHKSYTGVDDYVVERFSAPNTSHVQKSIQDFIAQDLGDYVLKQTFAICSYVPDFEAQALVRATFPNLYVFYPCGSDLGIFPVKIKREPTP